MSDWKQQVKRDELLKAAGVVIGLLFGCILAVWLLTRSLHKKPPTPPTPESQPASGAPGAKPEGQPKL